MTHKHLCSRCLATFDCDGEECEEFYMQMCGECESRKATEESAVVVEEEEE